MYKFQLDTRQYLMVIIIIPKLIFGVEIQTLLSKCSFFETEKFFLFCEFHLMKNGRPKPESIFLPGPAFPSLAETSPRPVVSQEPSSQARFIIVMNQPQKRIN